MMIKIYDKTKCSGCKACQNVCPKDCIYTSIDKEGFTYPATDISQCIECNLCNKACPIENNFARNENYDSQYYGAYNKDVDIMRDSSSGGIFWILARDIIDRDGTVYGAELRDCFTVEHNRAETLDSCEKFRKSKYLQSDIGYNFKKAKMDLDSGREVLFSGTPCQIAGLYSFLGKDYDNLVTCDVVCHGVPSKSVFNKYIGELNEKMGDKAVSICWRDKRYGWGPNRVSIQFQSGEELITTSQENPYQKGFLDNLYLRPICYECPYAKLPRISDVSLADFWGYEGSLTNINNNNGLSIVIISSDKGKSVFNKIQDQCEIEVVAEEYVRQKSRHAYMPPVYNSKREQFFHDLEGYNFLDELSKKYIFPTSSQKLYGGLKKLIKKVLVLK